MEEEETFFKAIKKIKALNRTAYGERSPLWLSVTCCFVLILESAHYNKIYSTTVIKYCLKRSFGT